MIYGSMTPRRPPPGARSNRRCSVWYNHLSNISNGPGRRTVKAVKTREGILKQQSRVLTLLAGVSAIAFAGPALAQATAGTGEAAVDEVVVTGSRIARTTFETPTPVTAVTEKELEAKAATTVVDLLRDIPALRPNQIQGGGRSIGVSNFNMRGLGSSRTLVLLDGQRLMDSSPLAGFDVNVLP